MVREELSVADNCLFRGTKLVPPGILREVFINLAHEGHLGITKTKQRLPLDYWWPNMDMEIERRIRECVPCSTSDKVLKQHTPPMHCRPLAEGPWADIALDIVGPLSGENRTPYTLVLMNSYSKWPELQFVSEITTKSVIEFLLEVFLREGLPSIILIDNGVQLCSREIKEFLECNGIKHRFGALYHPENNGTVEKFNKTNKECIQLAKASGLCWREEVTNCLEAYGLTPSNHGPFSSAKRR